MSERPPPRCRLHYQPVDRQWLASVVHLLDTMAGEGMGMEGCADPADLMMDLATHLGFHNDDDPWSSIKNFLAQDRLDITPP